MRRVAAIGECMIELSETEGGALRRAYGGDSLNTAVYLARLGVAVDYVSALGDDPMSHAMLEAWRHEGVGTHLVALLPGRLPGLYLIANDAAGERCFYYWRDSAPARELFELPQAPAIAAALCAYDIIYLTGVSLSLYGAAGRRRLLEALDAARAHGCRVAFDTNFRTQGWPDRSVARSAFRAALARADIVLASREDLDPLFGDGTPAELPTGDPSREVVVKLAGAAVRVHHKGEVHLVTAPPAGDVVDTTAAGDSFAAGYIAARLEGAPCSAAARSGHWLAGAVVRHRGAIIPRSAMPAALGERRPEES
jgi:2-dehydro-3-deoxygluconokinase